MLKLILLITVGVLALLTSSVLISFIIFSVNVSGKMFLLGFGARGISMFFLLFPWKILVINVLLLFLLEWLIKRFQFGYRRPFIYLLSCALAISIVAGLIINATPLHQAILKSNEERHLPVIGSFYEHLRRPTDGRDVVRGVVITISGNSLTLQADDLDNDHDDGIRKVIMAPPIQIPNFIKIGDLIFVAGDLRDDQIFAFGIRKIEPNVGNRK
ncbi:MAG: hypothetical protein WC843_06155 [Candidatus Gracilibacteria bacterium]